MKYIITESKLDRVVIKYLNKEYGDLKEYKPVDSHGVYYVKDKKVYMEHYLNGKILYIDNSIWGDLKNIFNIEYDEIQRIIKKWASETYKIYGVKPLPILD